MRLLFCAWLTFAVLGGVVGGCSHATPLNEDRYRSKVQVVLLKECQKLEALRLFELGLMGAGFTREPARKADPVPFELLENYLAQKPRLVSYTKTDFEEVTQRSSEPYKEIPNRYKITSCEEPGGALYLVIVRHDPDSSDKFLGARFTEALSRTSCRFETLAPPRELGFYTRTTEDDLLRYVRRGRCKDYALAR